MIRMLELVLRLHAEMARRRVARVRRSSTVDSDFRNGTNPYPMW